MVTTHSSSELEQALAEVQVYKAALAERTRELTQTQQALAQAQQRQQQLATRAEEQSQLLRYTYEGVDHCVVILDVIWTAVDDQPDFRFLSWNVATERTTGVASMMVLGKTPEEVFGPEQGAAVRQNYLQCIAAQTSITYEECLPFDGKDFWWLTTLSPMEDEQGQIYRLVLTTFNITDRKTAEMLLQAKEAQYRGIFEAVNDGFIVNDLTAGEFVAVNPAACHMHGYTREEFLQLSPMEVIHPDSEQQFRDFIATINTGQEFSCEAKTLCKDGTVLHIEVKGVPFSYNGVPHALGMVRDISERKAAAAAIAASEAKFRRLVEDADDLVYAIDGRGCFTYLSPQFQDMFGYPLSVLLGQSFILLVHPDDVHITQASVEQMYATGQRQTGLEFRVITATDEQLWLVCNNSPIRDADGSIVGFQGIGRDVTAQKQAAVQLAQQAQALQQALQELQQTQLQMIQSEKMSSLGQLVAGVAHEINNPVSFIYGNLKPIQTYIEDLLSLIDCYQCHYPEPQAEVQAEIEAIDLAFLKQDLPNTLRSIKMGAERIREIVSSLRTFSRLDEAACKAVDIHAGIDSSLVILKHRLKASAHRPAVEVVRDYGDLPLVECYAGQLNQVVINILTNALDAMEDRDAYRTPEEMRQLPSTVTVATQVLGCDRILISIHDNGPGIPDKIKDRIFDPFFTTKPVGKGTGMGMSISYQIITDHHSGRLQCDSSPTGTTFRIEIPRYQLDAKD